MKILAAKNGVLTVAMWKKCCGGHPLCMCAPSCHCSCADCGCRFKAPARQRYAENEAAMPLMTASDRLQPKPI